MHDWFYYIIANIAIAIIGLRIACGINKGICYRLSNRLLKLRNVINIIFILFEIYGISILSFNIIQMFCEITTIVEIYVVIIVVILVGEGNTIWRVD